MRSRVPFALGLVAAGLVVALPSSLDAQPSYTLFESVATRPLALSSDGATLYAVNTPDARLEVYDVRGPVPVSIASIPVGLEPVAVALRDDTEAWVVNKLSDSVSVVDLDAFVPHVVRTLLVGDEPSDVVFAGVGRSRAFVTSAHRGQNTPDPRGGYATPGIGRADVWVFDASAPGDDLLAAPITILSLFSDKPRALVASADGSDVYAAGFLTGNRTVTIPADALCDADGSCLVAGGTSPGPLPPPRTDAAGLPAPRTGLIVRYDDARAAWVDERGFDFSAFVPFSLPDYDVFRIDADAATPVVVDSIAHVGTVLFGMALDGAGRLYVANTEAVNRVRFEGPGTYVGANAIKPPGEPATVRGHLHEARVTVVDGTTVTPRRLNTHLDYGSAVQPADARLRSLAQPVGLALSGDGATLYVAAFGSSALGVVPTAALAQGTFMPDVTTRIELSGGGPAGVVLDEPRGRAFVATRFDCGLSVVSLVTATETAHVRAHDPEPADVIYGRPFLYDARLSGTGEASCGSCHVFGDLDGLAWDLGNPDDRRVSNPNFPGPVATAQPFSAMKGPMTTQTLRGMATHGPLHWRGDRTAARRPGGDSFDELGAFLEFAPAFDGLVGRPEGPLAPTPMGRFARFALAIMPPPNPIRALDGSFAADEQRGRDTYFEAVQIDAVTTCNGCHELDPSLGFFGANGRYTFENETQEFKIAHLRNAYDKVGMFGMAASNFLSPGDNDPTGPQVRGTGFLHDGSVDTLVRFLRATVFVGLNTDAERRDLEAFIMAFDSDLAPVVGQQVTLDAAATAAELQRATLLDTAAATPYARLGAPAARRCDVIAHGVVSGAPAGFTRRADGAYDAARSADGLADFAALVALATAPGNRLTLTCAPPGSGTRMGLDRDEDGVRDLDELDQGRDPADRPFPNPPIDPPEVDAGVEPPPRTQGSCGCTAGRTERPDVPFVVGAAVLGLALAVRRRQRRSPPS